MIRPLVVNGERRGVQGMGGRCSGIFGAMAMGRHHVAANTGKKRRRAAPSIRSERDALEIQRRTLKRTLQNRMENLVSVVAVWVWAAVGVLV